MQFSKKILLAVLLFSTPSLAAVKTQCDHTLVCELKGEMNCKTTLTVEHSPLKTWLFYHSSQRISASTQTDTTAHWDAAALNNLQPGAYTVRLHFIDTETNLARCDETEVAIELDRSKSQPFPIAKSNATAAEFKHLQFFSKALTQLRKESGVLDGSGVTVAVIDSGINPTHPEFKNITQGFDFVHGTEGALDDNGHGTEVASLIAGQRSGLAPQARILPIKAIDLRQHAKIESVTRAIYFAVDHGADIINISAGSSNRHFRELLISALEYAAQKNVLIIVAAGNQGRNLNESPYYPASLEAPNLITVGALNAPYSNHGRSVSVLAPGDTVAANFWPVHDGADTYAPQSGTSMSAPLVAGYAALLKQAHPDWSVSKLKQEIVTLNSRI